MRLQADPREVAEHAHLELELFELALDDVTDADDSDQGFARDRIFEWFKEDFAAMGGVLAFLELYAPGSVRSWLEQNSGRAEIHYLDYDWDLNDLARAPS